DAIFVHDVDAKILDVNEATLDLFGYKAEEIKSLSINDIGVHDSDIMKFGRDKIKKAINLGPQLFEWKILKKNGEIIPVEISLKFAKIKGEDRILAVLRDITERKILEQAVVESENRFRELFEEAADGIFIGYADGIIREVNNSLCELLGYSKNEIINKNLEILFRDEKIPNKPLSYSLLEEGDRVISQRNMVKKDGTILAVEMNTRRLAGGRIHTFIRDISGRKKAEQALIESEHKFKGIFNKSFSFIGLLNTDGKVLEINKTALDFIGKEKKDTTGLLFWDTPWWTHSVDEQDKLKESIDQASKGHTVRFETIHFSTEGTIHQVDFTIKPVIDEKGKVLFLIPEGRDITNRKRMEEALRASEEKFRNIFNNGVDAMIITDLEQNFLEVNDIVINFFGYSRNTFKEKKTFELVQPASIEKISKSMEQLKAGEPVSLYEIEIILPEGRLLPVEVGSKLINHEGKKAILSIFRDLSEKKELERKLLDTIIQTEEKERERFARNLHDDLGPLLSSIKMYINSLHDISNPGKQKFVVNEASEIIKEAIQTTRQISNDLSPHILMNYGLISALNSYLYKVRGNLEIKFDHDELKEIRFDHNLEKNLYRIIKELVNNTIKHARASFIFIKLLQKNDVLLIEYHDNGIGVDPGKEDIEGMGFFNIKNRVDSLNGKFYIDKNKRNGFSFFMTVPLED
ncbi:MAG: PAS domain-containing sensor histidine kinase, partial [bacterium]